MSNMAVNRTVAQCYENGSTNIPLPKSLNRSLNSDKWRGKFDESEKKRKTLIAQQERISRDYLDLEKKFKHLKLQNTVVEGELADKSDQLGKLRTASHNLSKEYSTLKNQYDNEIGAMHRALTDATGWYRQNMQLKRQSALFGGFINDVVDTGDGDGSQKELEGLRESVKELSANNARLQTELNEAKLTEFEANEQVFILNTEVDELERKCKTLEAELLDMKNSNDQMIRVSKIMREELKELQTAEEIRREEAVTLRNQADSARKERNVLAHQSTLLLQGIANDDDKVQFLQEIENLKRQLEDMNNKYERDIAQLQEKLEERENDSQNEILEERLKLVESELQHALERAERLENQSMTSAPPPPPPLPPPMPSNTCTIRIKTFQSTKPDTQDTAISLACMDKPKSPILGKSVVAPQPVIEDIVNQIKGGKFTLKSTNKANKKEREEPKAVSEMLKILGTLRRAPKPRNSLNLINNNHTKTVVDFADVQL